MSRHEWSVTVFHHYSFQLPDSVLITSSIFPGSQIYMQIVQLIFFYFYSFFFPDSFIFSCFAVSKYPMIPMYSFFFKGDHLCGDGYFFWNTIKNLTVYCHDNKQPAVAIIYLFPANPDISQSFHPEIPPACSTDDHIQLLYNL